MCKYVGLHCFYIISYFILSVPWTFWSKSIQQKNPFNEKWCLRHSSTKIQNHHIWCGKDSLEKSACITLVPACLIMISLASCSQYPELHIFVLLFLDHLPCSIPTLLDVACYSAEIILLPFSSHMVSCYYLTLPRLPCSTSFCWTKAKNLRTKWSRSQIWGKDYC